MNFEGPAVTGPSKSEPGATRQQDDDMVTPSLFDLPSPHRPRTGVEGMHAALRNEGPQGAAALRQLVLHVARTHRSFTADDVDHDLVAAVSPAGLPAIFGALAHQGVIREIGARRSTRPEARGRLVRVWELADDVA